MPGNIPGPVQLYAVTLAVVEGEGEEVKSLLFRQGQGGGGVESATQ